MTINRAVTAISDFIALGGPVVAVLLVLSVISLATILYKAAQFARLRVGRPVRAQAAVALWRDGAHQAAFDHAAQGRSPTAQSVADAMGLMMRRSGPVVDREQVEGAVAQRAGARLHHLQKGFRLLDAIAQVAPLLGLFGTVLGMIEAFRKLQGAGETVDPSILAGGIWVALMTTAVGLAVAMPTSLALTWLESGLGDERIAIETLASDVLYPETSAVERGGGGSGVSACPVSGMAHAT